VNGSACVPWYFPTPANQTINVCNPWESEIFLSFMSSVPQDICKCLPDCKATVYEPLIVSTPFRRCDSLSLGVSKLCDINNKGLPQPTMFGSQAMLEYNKLGVQSEAMDGIQSGKRLYAKTLPHGDVFTTNPQFYEAFQEDIAVVEICFRKSAIMQFSSQATMSWIDYFSAVGGLLGLVLGMGIVSFIEIFWVCLRLLALKLNCNHWIP